MSDGSPRKISVHQLFMTQVAINFVFVAILIAAAAWLVFKVMGEDYTQFTAIGFIATVFFSFIGFLPASTLFGARAELVRDKVAVLESERTGAKEPLADPLRETLPLGIMLAAASTAIAAAVIYGTGWTPTPVATTLVALLFVVPYAAIVRRTIFRDIEGLAATGPFHGHKVASKTGHIWASYILPGVVFQGIINMPLAIRSYSHAAAAIADQAGPGMVPVAALAPDLAITFMFVCSFTFLGVIAHTASDMYEGEFAYAGRARGINGFLYFGLLLLMGVGVGVVVGGGAQLAQVGVLPVAWALSLKGAVVIFSVYLAARLGVGWMGKKFNDAVKKKMAGIA